MIKISKILFPTDFSDISRKAAFQAVALCKDLKASLEVVHVMENEAFIGAYGYTPAPYPELEQKMRMAAEEKIEALCSELGKESHVDVHGAVISGVAAESICKYAETHPVDLIVMATHGRKGLPRFVLGSVTERVVRMSEKPVLTLRGKASDS